MLTVSQLNETFKNDLTNFNYDNILEILSYPYEDIKKINLKILTHIKNNQISLSKEKYLMIMRKLYNGVPLSQDLRPLINAENKDAEEEEVEGESDEKTDDEAEEETEEEAEEEVEEEEYLPKKGIKMSKKNTYKYSSKKKYVTSDEEIDEECIVKYSTKSKKESREVILKRNDDNFIAREFKFPNKTRCPTYNYEFSDNYRILMSDNKNNKKKSERILTELDHSVNNLGLFEKCLRKNMLTEAYMLLYSYNPKIIVKYYKMELQYTSSLFTECSKILANKGYKLSENHYIFSLTQDLSDLISEQFTEYTDECLSAAFYLCNKLIINKLLNSKLIPNKNIIDVVCYSPNVARLNMGCELVDILENAGYKLDNDDIKKLLANDIELDIGKYDFKIDDNYYIALMNSKKSLRYINKIKEFAKKYPATCESLYVACKMKNLDYVKAFIFYGKVKPDAKCMELASCGSDGYMVVKYLISKGCRITDKCFTSYVKHTKQNRMLKLMMENYEMHQ
jgi:hypothetical protein